MPAELTPVPTSLPSSCAISLPRGVSATPNGLTFSPNAHLPVDEWMSLGQQLKSMHRFTALCIGDWLAYGEFEYKDTQWSKRMPNGVYEQAAHALGCSVGWLKNLKSVCARIPSSSRPDKLTAMHLLEIAHKAEPNQREFWMDKAAKEGLSVKALREELKKSSSRFRTEPADTGMRSFIEEARQFARNYTAQCKDWSPRYQREVDEALRPVFEHRANR